MSLEYVTAYNQHCQLTLNSGRTITLESLRQWRTYRNVEGAQPFQRVNDRILEGARHEAQKLCINGGSPCLIPPIRRDYERQPGDRAKETSIGGAPVEWLPGVTVIAEFRASGPACDKEMDGSYLTVVWYQNEFALPIDPVIVDSLKALDWEALAMDFEF